MYVNAKGGTINPVLDDANNLKNILIHEKGHTENNAAKIESNLLNHAEVYANQLSDATFDKVTPDLQKSLIGSFANYVMNAVANSYVGAEKYVERFNANNTQGYKISVDTSPKNAVDFKTTIYQNNKKIGTVSYKQIENEK